MALDRKTYWFSIQCPDGVVQVVFTRGLSVSIAGCWLKTMLCWIFFYRHPGWQAGTACLHPLPGHIKKRWTLKRFSAASWASDQGVCRCIVSWRF
jgi:hypothetical protein